MLLVRAQTFLTDLAPHQRSYRVSPDSMLLFQKYILPLYRKLGYLNLYGPLTVSDLFFDFFVEIFGVF